MKETQSSDNGLHLVIAALSEIRITQLAQVEKYGKMEGHLEALAGPTGRVTTLEKHNSRQWWVTVCIAPALAILHATARKFGVDV